LSIRQRLEDELHLRHLAIDVLAELLDVGDGQLAARTGAAAVVLPALERQVVVDLLVRAAETRQRDPARLRVRREERGLEERLREGGGSGLVHLTKSAALADEHRPCVLLARAAAAGRDERQRSDEHREQEDRQDRTPPSR